MSATLDRAPAALSHPSVWSADEMRARPEWLYRLSAEDVEDLESAVGSVLGSGRHPMPDLMALGVEDFPLPRLGPKLADMRRTILHGRGFVQLRGLPVTGRTPQWSATAFWALGRHLGDDVVSQNAKGHVLGHVCDLGESRANPDQRGPYSSETIPFHVDCCDIVGLLCLQTASEGGESSLVSSGHLHNLLLAERPDLVQALAEPYYRDRRGEIPPGMEPWYAIPIFNHFEGLLSVSIEPTYIGSVARHFGGREPHSPVQLEAFERLQALAAEHCLDIAFEPGDAQFLCNQSVMHSRRAFVDRSPRRRHLLRLWLVNFDGRPLPDCFYERHGPRRSVARPGGIVGPDTVLSAPLTPG